MMENLTVVDWAALVLVVVGALNWGLVGVAKFNLVEAVLGEESMLTRVVYCLVGVAGLYTAYLATMLVRK